MSIQAAAGQSFKVSDVVLFNAEQVGFYRGNIERALDEIPHYWDYEDKELHFERLLKGAIQCWGFGTDSIQFIVMTSVRSYETEFRVLHCLGAWGEGEPYFDSMMGMLNHVARSYGCQRVEMSGRAGWARKLQKHGVVKVDTIITLDVQLDRRH